MDLSVAHRHAPLEDIIFIGSIGAARNPDCKELCKRNNTHSSLHTGHRCSNSIKTPAARAWSTSESAKRIAGGP